MAYKQFDPALSIPVNFSVRDNPYPNSKEKFPKQLRIFVPKSTIDEWCTHLQNAKSEGDWKTGKVRNMETGQSEEVEGIFINGMGRKSTFEEDEDSCFGTINPRKIELHESEEIPF